MSEQHHSLVMPFLDGSDSFVHGFECGQIYAEMESGRPLSKRLAHCSNEQQIAMMAKRMGYAAPEIEYLDDTWLLFDSVRDLTQSN